MIEYSSASLEKTKPIGMAVIKVFRMLGILQVNLDNKTKNPISINNLTLINLILVKFGPMHEDKIVWKLLFIHIICSLVAFTVRYALPQIWY